MSDCFACCVIPQSKFVAFLNEATSTSFGILRFSAFVFRVFHGVAFFLAAFFALVGVGGDDQDDGKEGENGCVFHDEFLLQKMLKLRIFFN